MITLNEINKMETKYFIKNPDKSSVIYNKISRAKIRLMKKENSKCFIWNFNPWDNRPICRQYKRGMVFNFDGSFITDKYDQFLEKMLQNRLNRWESCAKDWKKINEIWKYVIENHIYSVLIWA